MDNPRHLLRLVCMYGLLSVAFFCTAFAQSEHETDEPVEIHVTPLDPGFPAEKLGRGYKIHKLSERKNLPRNPRPSKREEILADAGLTSAVKSWDQLERDLLLMRAKSYSSEKLAKKYPRLPASALRKLHEAVYEEGAEQ